MNNEHFLSSKEAASLLGYTDNTMRISRMSNHGRLAGIKAPPFVMLGTRVRYRRKDLDEWVKNATKECG